MISLVSNSINTFRGFTRVPGDKSISHRALMIGAISVGTTDIHGLLISDDVLHTANALEEMGVNIERKSNRLWEINGVGVGGLREPNKTIDMGNSGTGARLLMGLVATHPIKVHFTGDDSLRKRPMERIATPLAQMGTRIIAQQDNKMPLTIVKPGTQTRRFTHIDDTIKAVYFAWRKNKNRHYSISNKKSYSIIKVARLFTNKIKFLPKRNGERYASALTDMNLSNKVYKLFGKKDLISYINNFKKNIS